MDIYGLIGYPLHHSFSHKFFSDKFKDEKISAAYFNFEIADISSFPDILLEHNSHLCGLNVTIPYKEKIIPYLDELDSQAESIGAVNVIQIRREGDRLVMKGYNSDIVGFQNSISPLLKPFHKKALVLGTGGASKAVMQGLKNLGIEAVAVSRSSKENCLTYDDLTEDVMTEYQVIVNATPQGTYPNIEERPEIPYQYITASHLLYDLVYNPEVTAFLKCGQQNGALVKNGYEMLRLQALAAWDIWKNN